MKTSSTLKSTIVHGDCREVLSTMPPDTVHLVLTDPPYFLDSLDDAWTGKTRPVIGNVVKNLPGGMKFDPAAGARLQEFIHDVTKDILRVMRPGSFCLMFSQPRLVHRMASGMESAGLEIRDLYAWRFTRQARQKAARQEHWIRRRKDWSETQKEEAIRTLGGRRTAQLRPSFESIVVGQKPTSKTLYETYLDHGTGLVDTEAVDGLSTVFTIEKEMKASWNDHLSVKPVALLEKIIKVFTKKGQVVLDPFLGSGSTAVAAKREGRICVGVERNEDYYRIACRREDEA